jgi:hypothetical protein
MPDDPIEAGRSRYDERVQSWYVDDPDMPPPPIPSDVGDIMKAEASVERQGRSLWPGWPWPEPVSFSGILDDLADASGDSKASEDWMMALSAVLITIGMGAFYVLMVACNFVAKVLVAGIRLAMVQVRRVHRQAVHRRTETRRRQRQAERDAWQAWSRWHRITHDDLYRESYPHVLELADRLVWARNAVQNTRTWREEISGEWQLAIGRQVWSMLRQLRDSLHRREALAEARDRPALADAVADSTAKIEALDAEASALAEHLTGLAAQAQQLDQDLAVRDEAERDARHEAELRARLTGTSVEPTDVERELNMVRDRLLSSAAEADLTTLSAHLEVLGQTLRPARSQHTISAPEDPETS